MYPARQSQLMQVEKCRQTQVFAKYGPNGAKSKKKNWHGPSFVFLLLILLGYLLEFLPLFRNEKLGMTPLCNNGSLLSLLKQTRNKKYSLLNIQILNSTSCLLLQPFLAIFGRGSDHAFVISSVLCFLDRHSSSNFKVSLQSLYPLSKLLISFILNARSRVNHPLSLSATCVTTDLVLSLKL